MTIDDRDGGSYFTLIFQPRVTQYSLPKSQYDEILDWIIILMDDDPANNSSDDD